MREYGAARSLWRDLWDRLLRRPQQKQMGLPLLLLASNQGEEEVVTALLDRGARDVNAADEEGHTALLLEAEAGHRENVKRLLQHGAKPDGDPRPWASPLMAAIDKNRDIELARILLDAGAKVDPGPHGITPLSLAAENAQPAIVRLLLQRGANVNASDSDGDTPLMAVMRAGDGNENKALRKEAQRVIIRLLLAKKADPNAWNRFGASALSIAADGDAIECVDSLLRAGANPNVGFRYGSPLMSASGEGNTKLVKRLLGAGADVNMTRQKWGETALHDAAEYGRLEIVKILIAHGANAKGGYEDGHFVMASHGTPREKAERSGYKEIANLLLQIEEHQRRHPISISKR